MAESGMGRVSVSPHGRCWHHEDWPRPNSWHLTLLQIRSGRIPILLLQQALLPPTLCQSFAMPVSSWVVSHTAGSVSCRWSPNLGGGQLEREGVSQGGDLGPQEKWPQ